MTYCLVRWQVELVTVASVFIHAVRSHTGRWLQCQPECRASTEYCLILRWAAYVAWFARFRAMHRFTNITQLDKSKNLAAPNSGLHHILYYTGATEIFVISNRGCFYFTWCMAFLQLQLFWLQKFPSPSRIFWVLRTFNSMIRFLDLLP